MSKVNEFTMLSIHNVNELDFEEIIDEIINKSRRLVSVL